MTPPSSVTASVGEAYLPPGYQQARISPTTDAEMIEMINRDNACWRSDLRRREADLNAAREACGKAEGEIVAWRRAALDWQSRAENAASERDNLRDDSRTLTGRPATAEAKLTEAGREVENVRWIMHMMDEFGHLYNPGHKLTPQADRVYEQIAQLLTEKSAAESRLARLGEPSEEMLSAMVHAYKHTELPLLTSDDADTAIVARAMLRAALAFSTVEKKPETGGRGREQTETEKGWVIERYINSRLHYWHGRGVGPEHFLLKHDEAIRFARECDAALVLSWLFGGMGRVAEHVWNISALEARAAKGGK